MVKYGLMKSLCFGSKFLCAKKVIFFQYQNTMPQNEWVMIKLLCALFANLLLHGIVAHLVAKH